MQPSSASRSLTWRAAFAASQAMSMGIGAFGVIAVSVVSPMMVPELGLSRTELGSIATLAFAVAAATSVLGGRQVDMHGGRAVIMWIFVSGGTAAAVIAGAPSLMWLWLGAALGGAGQGLANPATNQLIADHIPAGRQGTQIGIKQSGVPMAQALTGFVLPPLALVVGWRGSVLLGVVLGVLGILVARTVIPRGHASTRGSTGMTKRPLDPLVWRLTIYTFMIAMTITAVTVYAPLHSFERVGLTATAAGMTTGVVGTAGIVARILWGRLAEQWDAPIQALRVLAAIAFVSVLLILLSEHVAAWTLWLGLVGFGASALAANAVVMLSVIRGVGGGSTGRATGRVGLGLFLGFMAGPVSFGALVDGTGSYTVGWSAVALICLGALAITLVRQQNAGNATEA